MDKKSLADRLMEVNEGNPVMKITDIMKTFDIGYLRVRELTSDLVSVSGKGKRNRAKYFFVDDVADAVMRKGL